MPVGTLLLVVLAVGAVLYFRRHPSDAERARFVRRSAFGFLAFLTVFLGLFVVGETLADPGGAAAVAWIATWLVPLTLLALLARYRPAAAVPVCWVLTGLMVALAVWAALDSGAWRTFEDDHGPVRAIAVFALTAALAVLGLRQPFEAGLMLVVIGAVPALLATAGRLHGGSLIAAATPALIGGVLYLIAAQLAGGSPSRVAERPGQPTR